MKCPNCGYHEGAKFCIECGHSLIEPARKPQTSASPEPTSFAGGRYRVNKFLGEGGFVITLRPGDKVEGIADSEIIIRVGKEKGGQK